MFSRVPLNLFSVQLGFVLISHSLGYYCVPAGYIRKWQNSGRLVVVGQALGLLEVWVSLVYHLQAERI